MLRSISFLFAELLFQATIVFSSDKWWGKNQGAEYSFCKNHSSTQSNFSQLIKWWKVLGIWR